MIIESEMAEKLKNEPMFVLFKYKGFLCCIQRFRFTGSYNAYVAIGNQHPLSGKQYNDLIKVKDIGSLKMNHNYMDIFLCNKEKALKESLISVSAWSEAHGGLTYSEPHCPMIEEKIFPDKWWFGFDANHYGDDGIYPICPRIPRRGTYRDYDYILKEVERLVDKFNDYKEIQE
jgi:hypothetical protein